MQLWSWILTAVGVTGLYIAGRKSWVGWAIGLCAQVLWVAYALSTRQFGFLVSAGAYGWVYAKNLRAWRKQAADADRVGVEETTRKPSHAPECDCSLCAQLRAVGIDPRGGTP